VCFFCRQIHQLLALIKTTNLRVELLVTAFARTVDWYFAHVDSILGIFIIFWAYLFYFGYIYSILGAYGLRVELLVTAFARTVDWSLSLAISLTHSLSHTHTAFARPVDWSIHHTP